MESLVNRYSVRLELDINGRTYTEEFLKFDDIRNAILYLRHNLAFYHDDKIINYPVNCRVYHTTHGVLVHNPYSVVKEDIDKHKLEYNIGGDLIT